MSKLGRVQRLLDQAVAGASPACRVLHQYAVPYQASNVTQRGVLRAFSKPCPFGRGQLAFKPFQETTEHGVLAVVDRQAGHALPKPAFPYRCAQGGLSIRQGTIKHRENQLSHSVMSRPPFCVAFNISYGPTFRPAAWQTCCKSAGRFLPKRANAKSAMLRPLVDVHSPHRMRRVAPIISAHNHQRGYQKTAPGREPTWCRRCGAHKAGVPDSSITRHRAGAARPPSPGRSGPRASPPPAPRRPRA